MTRQESAAVWRMVSRRCEKIDVKLELMSWLWEAVTAPGKGVESALESCLFLPLLALFPSPDKVFVKIAQLSAGDGWVSAVGGDVRAA